MKETLRLSYIDIDGNERRAELIAMPVRLDENTWHWLKGAFVGMGFAVENVEEFFSESTGGKSS